MGVRGMETVREAFGHTLYGSAAQHTVPSLPHVSFSFCSVVSILASFSAWSVMSSIAAANSCRFSASRPSSRSVGSRCGGVNSRFVTSC